ncbi:MAG: thioredoxin domain-containing protein [Myxococcales bacterium]|nr:thioredoxin domain-containing protein [Myxococcales bacterium]
MPAASPFSVELVHRLEEAWASRPGDYAPRTRHLRADGTPLYTNRLLLESSPYLRQHAHNPVNWYPWGDEAFETARALGRPVLLSIGYSTCHWCHVMEEESFEDEEIAAFLNANYVAIKVDREERPDLDAVYMQAVVMLTGNGGWPMTVWLTADREPFFGGTYFPPRDGVRGARTGFLTLLGRLRQSHDADPSGTAASARELAERVRSSLSAVPEGRGLPGTAALDAAFDRYGRAFDAENGGLRGAPKFPSGLPLRFLLRQHRRTGAAAALQMVTLTLEHMATGGIYDQVGGGFHRYATDAAWRVPHFEKMLYDNALLAVAYLEAYEATGRADFARVVREVLRYVERDMTSEGGAFYSATDADSLGPRGEREEGWFFTWTPAEIGAALDADQAELVRALFDVTDAGNFEGRNVLHLPRPLEIVATGAGGRQARLMATIGDARERLYAARRARPSPLRDEKILTAWNGLMISAFARAASTLAEPAYLEQARRAAAFVLSELWREGRLLRSYKDGRARYDGYLDDYAFFTASLIDLFEATGERRWLAAAFELTVTQERLYADPRGGYFMTSADHEALLAREKPGDDGAEPSGNSVAALNLLRLHALTGDDRYRQRAEATIGAFSAGLTSGRGRFSELLLALDWALDRPKEIAIVTPDSRDQARPFLDALHGSFVPNKVVVVAVQGADLGSQAELVPLLEAKIAIGGKPTAYVCEQQRCELPTTDPGAFAEQLRVPTASK